MAKRFRLNGPQLAGVTFGLAVLLIAALAASRGCSSPTPQVVVVVDTVAVAPQRPHTPKSSTSKRRKSAKSTPQRRAAPRDFRRDTVN
ncbi:MAG: hypothetical protein ACI391_07030 [Muribaculaceae bacterium]